MSDFDMPAPNAGFDKRAAWVVAHLITDLGITAEQAAGIVGNLGGESGLLAIQEAHPLAGMGGFGWEQATGPRRTAFEAFAAEHGLTVKDDEANYEFLLFELRGSEAHALEKLKLAVTTEGATETFCIAFERPSDPEGTMPNRVRWAHRAMDAYHLMTEPVVGPTLVNDEPVAPVVAPVTPPMSTGHAVVITGGAVGILASMIFYATHPPYLPPTLDQCTTVATVLTAMWGAAVHYRSKS